MQKHVLCLQHTLCMLQGMEVLTIFRLHVLTKLLTVLLQTLPPSYALWAMTLNRVSSSNLRA